MNTFGIHLGTTHSSIALYNRKTCQVDVAMLDSAVGAGYFLPSAVYVEGPGNILVSNAYRVVSLPLNLRYMEY